MAPTLRLLILAALAALGAGCATPRIELFLRAPVSVPKLAGKSIAVLPTLAVGTEAAPAALCIKALDKVFAGELGDVRWTAPHALLPRCREHSEAFEAIEEKVTARLPTDAAPEGDIRTLWDDSGRLTVTLQESVGDLVAALAPEALPAESLAPFGGDYVLVSAAFTSYRSDTEVTALYGLVPVFGSVVVHELSPRALFALYETASGAKVWEGCVGTLASANAADPPLGIDPRELPVLGAFYLLTGDIRTGLARLER